MTTDLDNLVLLSFEQAGEALQVSRLTIANLVAAGSLPTVTVKGIARVWSDDLQYLATDNGLAAVAAALPPVYRPASRRVGTSLSLRPSRGRKRRDAGKSSRY